MSVLILTSFNNSKAHMAEVSLQGDKLSRGNLNYGEPTQDPRKNRFDLLNLSDGFYEYAQAGKFGISAKYIKLANGSVMETYPNPKAVVDAMKALSSLQGF